MFRSYYLNRVDCDGCDSRVDSGEFFPLFQLHTKFVSGGFFLSYQLYGVDRFDRSILLGEKK